MTIQGFKLALVPETAVKDSGASVRVWAETLIGQVKDVKRIELDLLDQEAQSAHVKVRMGGYPSPGFTAIVSLWASAAPSVGPKGYRMVVLRVTDRIGYGFEDDALGPVGGYKKFSFWKARSGVPRETWDTLYAHHIITVPKLQPIWRYRQNIISEKTDNLPFDAISENWWKTLYDLGDGFYFSEASKKAVQEEVSQFIDLNVTANFVGRNTLLYKA